MASENMHMTAPCSALCEKDNIGVIGHGRTEYREVRAQ